MKTPKFIVAGMALLYGSAAAAQDLSSATLCELHIWPSEDHDGAQHGLLMGVGFVGAAADRSMHAGKNRTIQASMRDYLSPEAQVEELRAADAARALGLPDHRIVVEQPIPSKKAVKADSALKQRRDAMNALLNGAGRLSETSVPCYAELIGTRLYYHKDPINGSQLYTGWTLRDFGRNGATKPVVSKGQVKNSARDFPPKASDMIAAAQSGLREAYRNGFVEWVRKKQSRSLSDTAAR